MVSPSPTVSMLSSILWSLCSFLLRLSKFWEVRSLGAGFTTFPLHSTFKYSDTRTVFIWLLFKTGTGFMSFTYVVNCNDPAFSQELQRLLIISVIVEFISINEHKVIRPSLSCCYEVIWWNQKLNIQFKHKPLWNYKICKSTYSEFSLLFHAVHQSYFQLQPTEKKGKIKWQVIFF